MKKTFLLFIAFFSLAGAQDYLWPTNASPYLSSSFCEYRPGHFHAAIDIKTWNREGYPCYAVEDAVVERVRISTFGGGKALYLRLKDGRIAVYYHLQRFTAPLEKMIFDKQIREERYAVEIWPKNYKVQKGDIVAYTGQTGIGVPHLHFEVRNKNNEPLNPLRFYPRVKDSRAPVLKSLALIPLDAAGTVNGRHETAIVALKKAGARYIPAEPLSARGRIGLALNGYDLADGVYNKLAFYGTRLYADGREIFSQSFDVMPFSKTAQVEIFVLKAPGRGRFQKLYIDPYNTLPLYRRPAGNGILHITDSSRHLRLEARDYKGNTARVSLTIKPEPPLPAVYAVTRLNGTLYVKTAPPRGVHQLHFYSGTAENKLRRIDYFEMSFPDSQWMAVRFPLGSPRDSLWLMEADGRRSPLYAVQPETVADKTLWTIDHQGKFLTLSLWQSPPGSELRIGERAPVYPAYAPFQQLTTDSRFFKSGVNRLRWQRDGKTLKDTLLQLWPLYPGRADSISFFGDSLRLIHPARGVYDTLLVTLQKSAVDDTLFSTPVGSAFYRLNGGGRILRKALTADIRIDSSLKRRKHVHAYGLKGNRLSFWGGDSLDGTYLRLKMKRFGAFVLAADTVAPELKWDSPADSVVFNPKKEIVFHTQDSLSGIGSERNIHVSWNGRFLLPEWDFERHRVTSRLHFKPQKGAHRLEVTVKDRAGNVRRETRTVFIK